MAKHEFVDLALQVDAAELGQSYPFSYDSSELAAYYAAWHRLTQRWQSTLGESLLVLKYEDLVIDLESASRRPR